MKAEIIQNFRRNHLTHYSAAYLVPPAARITCSTAQTKTVQNKTKPAPDPTERSIFRTIHKRVFTDCWRAFGPLWPTRVLLRCEDGMGWRRDCLLLWPSLMLLCSWAPPWRGLFLWIGVCLQIMWRVGCVCMRGGPGSLSPIFCFWSWESHHHILRTWKKKSIKA